MAEYNASDPKQIRALKKAAKANLAERKLVVLNLMSSSAGRDWVHDWLTRCHVFHTPFTGVAPTTDFNCGEQNIGLQLLGEVMGATPDQYIQMMREQSDKEQANGRRTDDRPDRGSEDTGGDDSGLAVPSDYDPDPGV